MIRMWDLMYGNSEKFVRVFLFLAIFCTSLDSHAQDDPIISGFGTATIDGIKQRGEWASAGHLIFDAWMVGQQTEKKAFVILYAMTDDNHLFLGLVTEPGLLDPHWLRISLEYGSESTEFYFKTQTGQLFHVVPGARPEWQSQAPDCCQAKFGRSQGYDMLEFEYAFVLENSNSGLSVQPGKGLNLQMSLVTCPELPGEDDCWTSEHDVFLTDSGKIEVVIQIVEGSKH